LATTNGGSLSGSGAHAADHTAIAQNYDVRIAAARVLEAQAQVGITRSNQFPSASVGADIYSQQNASDKSTPAYQVNAGD